MADADKELKIRIVTDADTMSVEDYNSELRKVTGNVEDNTERTLRNSAASIESSGTHWELRRAFESLSQVIPGLGPITGVAAEGFREVAAAEYKAAAAADVLKDSLMIGLVIGIVQTIVSGWDRYKEKLKEVAEATKEAMRQIQEDTQKATEAYQDFENVLAGEDKSPTKKYQDEISRRRQITEALNQQAETEFKAAEAGELANAASSVEKAAIEQKYQDMMDQFRVQSKADQSEPEAEALQKAEADLANRRAMIEKYNAELKWATPDRQAFLEKQISDLSRPAAQLAQFINDLRQNAATAETVNAINTRGFLGARASQGQATFETGVRAAMGDYGPKLDAKQQAALQEVQALFQSVHGNMDVWLNYLREFRLTNDQKMRDIDSELGVLQGQVSRMPTQTMR